MKKTLLALFLLVSFISFSQPPTDARLKGLDTFALRVLKDWHAAGVTIAVVEKGKVVYRPTVHYAYHPCDDAVLSIHELAGKNWDLQSNRSTRTRHCTRCLFYFIIS